MGWRGWKQCVHRQEIIKMDQFRPEITKIKVSTFWMSGKSTDSRRRPIPASSLVSFKQSRLSFCDIWPRQRPNIRKNAGFGPFGAGYPSSNTFKTMVDMRSHRESNWVPPPAVAQSSLCESLHRCAIKHRRCNAKSIEGSKFNDF